MTLYSSRHSAGGTAQKQTQADAYTHAVDKGYAKKAVKPDSRSIRHRKGNGGGLRS